MKKVFVAFSAIFVLIFVSCKTQWKTDFDSAQKEAQSKNKAIFLNITSFGTDSISENLQKSVFEDAKFGRKYSKKFVLVNLDFSERMKMTNLGADASEEDVLKMQKVLDETKPAMEIAQRYAVRDLPTTLLCTAEGFVVRRLDFFEIKNDFDPNAPEAENAKVEDIVDIFDFEKVCATIDEALPALEEAQNRVKIANDESKAANERVDAINALFENTDFAYQRLLKNLSEKAIELDPTNSSGKIAQHVVALALADDNEDATGTRASESYEKAANHPALSADDRQFLYFQAATSFSRSQNDSDFESAGGFDKIAELLQKSLESAPESQFAPAIQSAINDFGTWRANIEEAKKQSENGEIPPAQEVPKAEAEKSESKTE